MQKTHLFGSAAFYRRALSLGLPIMLQSLIQTLISLIDNFMVAGLGDMKMSAVNVANQITFVFIVLMNALCMSGGIFLTQYSGAKNREGMRQSVCFKLITLAPCIAVYMIVAMAFPRGSMALLLQGNTQAAGILDEAEIYLFLMGVLGIPVMLSTVIASSFREIGEVKAPLLISIAATCLNTFFNWLFIYGNWGMPRMEVAGAALATIIARTTEMLLYILLLLRRRPDFMIRLHTLAHIDWKLFGKILKKGALVLLSEMLWSVSETVSTALYNSRGGADVVSGIASSFAIANLFFIAIGGVNTATSIIIGQSLGAGELDEARREKRWLLSGAMTVGLLMTLAGVLTLPLIPAVFASLSESARDYCRQMVLSMAMLMPIWVYVNAQFAIARAGGDTLMGGLVDGVCTVFLCFPLMFYLALGTSVSPVAIYIATKLVDGIKVIIAGWWLKKEKWVRNLAAQPESIA